MIIDEIFDLFARFGSRHYGEGLSLERHMLQSAVAAQSMGAGPNVVCAALLHDIGYFLETDGEATVEAGRNFGHEGLGAAWLSRAFDKDVTAPVALHVEAKRYLCTVEPDYFRLLSEASRISLRLQGGCMSSAEVKTFVENPSFADALILRRADDCGKDLTATTPPLADFRDLLMASLRCA